MNLILTVLIGALVGWLAGKIMKDGGYGPLINTLLGIVGGFVGSFLFKLVNGILSTHIVGDIIKGLVGALVILFIAEVIKKDEPK